MISHATAGTAAFLLLVFFLAPGLGAQEIDTLFQRSDKPSTVVDYFIFCPFLEYQSDPQEEHWLSLSDKPHSPASEHYLSKQLLLQGAPLDIRHQPTNLVVDVRNGYVHVTLDDDDVTVVYYERADKSRIVGVRYEYLGGQFWYAKWQFYDVAGSTWTPLDRDKLLPPGWLSLYLPKTPTAQDRDALALTDFDIDLPHFGTTAHLIPQQYESDLDGRSRLVTIPGTKRTMTQGAYWDWFGRVFRDRTLELKWNKPAGRFDAGKLAAWEAPRVPDEKRRTLYEVYHHPRNIWESFVVAPDLVYAGESGLLWNPNGFVPDEELRDSANDAEFPYESKQDILMWGGWGEMRPRTETIIDVPARYLSIDVVQKYWDRDADAVVEGESFELTMAGFETAAKGAVIGYRLWGRTTPELDDYPKPEHNQIAAVFFTYGPSGDPVPLNEDDVLPLKQIGSLVLPGASNQDQTLQAQVIWDVVLPRGSGPLLLKPWRLAYGADEKLTPAFEVFVKQWYSDRVVALDWNPKTQSFEKPQLVKKP